MVTSATYFSKIQRFEELYEDRVSTALHLLPAATKEVLEIERSQAIIKSAVQELISRYKALYIERNSTLGKDNALRLTRLEANIAMATQQNLEAMQKIIRLHSSDSSRFIRTLRLKVILHSMRKINASLARRDDAAPISKLVAVKQLLCAGRKPFKTFFTIVAVIGLHRPISDLARSMDPSNFFRSEEVTFQGVDTTRELFAGHPRRVLVIIGNHDTSLYDGTIGLRLAFMLGSQHHISMARKSVYPIPPPESAGDVVYVDEDDPTSYPIAESISKIKEFLKKNDVVSIAVFPEGMLAFTGAQMPLVTKEGVYVIARKLAIELKDHDVPVFLVEEQSNTLVHLTQHDFTEAVVKVTGVEIVPADPLAKGKADEWIEERRLESENRFNTDRGEKMLDILHSTRIPGSITYDARGLSCEGHV